MSRLSAEASSIRTKSFGSSRRRPPVASFVFQPVQPDNCQKGVAISYALVDRLPKVTSGFNCSHIHEYRLITELRRQVIKQPACLAFRIVSPVIDENGTQSKPPDLRTQVIEEMTLARENHYRAKSLRLQLAAVQSETLR